MFLDTGRRLGPYEVVSPIGAGAMGEVYRARDTRLGRDVALKILPAEHSGDSNRLRRFELEARAVAALEHPSIVALHDVGTEDGVPFVVFELIEGSTLRERLKLGPLPVRRAVDLAIQVCHGLVAAHSRSIVHRDLKPENLALTQDGRIKILDFGLAKLFEPLSSDADSHETRTATVPGAVMGTVGYMSPEQVCGQRADARSDIFSMGAILYEMLSGQRAFDAATSADTLSAILHHDPPAPVTSVSGIVSPALAEIVRHCLEKKPDHRFQTARDLGFALETLSGVVSPELPIPKHTSAMRRLLPLAAALGLFAVLGGAFFLGRRQSTALPAFKQLTFRKGVIVGARFNSDGSRIAYSGLFDGNPAETYTLGVDHLDAIKLDLPTARITSLSSSGELALVLGKPGDRSDIWTGTLARAPVSGGAPRRLLDDIVMADWAPNGEDLAAFRVVGDAWQLEYPLGHVLLRPVPFQDSTGAMRVSPRGDKVAITTVGSVTVVDRNGRTTILKAEPASKGMAWDPSGEAVWVARRTGESDASGLWRLGLDGVAREAARLPGAWTLSDVSRDGRLLAYVGFERQGIRAKTPGEASERELCPGSVCGSISLSSDGSQVLFVDRSRLGTPHLPGPIFERPTSGGAPIRLGYGFPMGFSPDGNWVLMRRGEDSRPILEMVPRGPGTPKALDTSGLELCGASFLDSDRVLLDAGGGENPLEHYVLDVLRNRRSVAIAEGIFAIAGSTAGDSVLGMAGDRTLAWYPLDGGRSRPVAARCPADMFVLRLSADQKFLFVGRVGVPARIDRLELATGRQTPWRTLLPDDPTGFGGLLEMTITADGASYAYVYMRFFQDLYLIDGVR